MHFSREAGFFHFKKEMEGCITFQLLLIPSLYLLNLPCQREEAMAF